MRLHTKTAAFTFFGLFTLIFSAVFAPAAMGQLNWDGNVLSGNGDLSDPVNINNWFDLKPTGTGINILSTINTANICTYGNDPASQTTFFNTANTTLLRMNGDSTLNIASGVELTTGEIQIGYTGSGNTQKATFTADGTTIKSANIIVGYANGGYGSANINNSTINAAGFWVGYATNSKGDAVITDSTINATGEFRVGSGTTAPSTAKITDSTIESGSFIVAYYNKSDGAATLTNTTVEAKGYFIVGKEGRGELEMTGGSVHSTNNFIVGDGGNGDGTVTLTNVAVTTNSEFLLAKGGASGSVTMNADSLTSGTIKSTNFFIGGGGGSVGEMFLNGGKITASGQLRVGSNSPGYLTMTGGSFEPTGNFYVGWHADGTINQSGGTIKATNVYFSDMVGAKGEYTMSKDSEFIVQGTFSVGQHDRGILTVNGGTVTATGRTLLLGGGESKNTAYGTLNLHQIDSAYASNVNIADVHVGSTAQSHGDINITGGNLNATGNLYVGQNSPGKTIDGSFVHGGTVNQSGGNVSAASVIIGDTASSTGLYNISNGTLTSTNELIVGSLGTGTLTVSGGTIDADTLTLDNSNKGSTFNLTGSKSIWNLGTVTSNANGIINLRLDSDGLSTLAATGNADISGKIDITSVPGVAIIKDNAFDFVTGSSVTANPTYTATAANYFNEVKTGTSLGFAFNDANIEPLKFGGLETLTYETPAVSGWIRLEDDPTGDLGTLRLTFFDSLYNDVGNTATGDDLLLYLSDSLAGFGYNVEDATPADSEGAYYFDIGIPDDLFLGGAAYVGWDFGAFNAEYSSGVGLTGAASVPEPATWCMLLAGLMGLVWFRRRR